MVERRTSPLSLYRLSSPERMADIVFVHGLTGTADKTWASAPGVDNFWPIWLSDYGNIWVLEYPAELFWWVSLRGTAMALPDRARSVIDYVVNHNICAKPIVFVTHSLGGLLVKSMLRVAHDLEIPKWTHLLRNTRGVAFLATPHTGSTLGTFAERLSKALGITINATQLKANEPHLRDLAEWYSKNANVIGIRSLAYWETGTIKGITVVDPESGNPHVPDGIVAPSDENHVTICKPQSRRAPVYLGVLRFVEEALSLPEKSAREGSSTVAAQRGIPSAISNVPLRVPKHFMGRDDVMVQIDAALLPHEGRPGITALHGLRGAGKTTVAAAYAHQHASDYKVTWWIRAHSPDAIRADLVAFGIRVGWVSSHDNEGPALAAVMERLKQEGDGMLLVFDNAVDPDALNPHLPRGGNGHVIITSNTDAWRSVAVPIQISLWSSQTGADYLIARTGAKRERVAAQSLSIKLGGLPLAHDQAATYCERLHISLSRYEERFDAKPEVMIDDDRYAPDDYHGGRTVGKTFALGIEEAKKLHSGAEAVITYAALTMSDEFPLFVFEEGVKHFREPALKLTKDELDEAVGALLHFALVDRKAVVDEYDQETVTDTLFLHPIVRVVATSRLPDKKHRKAALCAIIKALGAVYPDDVFNRPETWPRARRLDALALTLVGLDIRFPKGVMKIVAQLLTGLAFYRHFALGAYAQAQALYERALEIRKEVLKPDDPDIAESLTNLANLLQDEGHFEAAGPLYERALAIYEDRWGPTDANTAESLNNLARLRHDQNNFSEALDLYERALAIRRDLDPRGTDTAETLNNLANLLQDKGELESARQLYEQALEIRIAALGQDNPDTAESMNNFASLYRLHS